MKKIIIIALIAVLSTAAFAAKVTVTHIEGRVTMLSESDWIPVKEGMILDLEDTINTGLNSVVILDNGVYIKPMKKGKLSELSAKPINTIVLGSTLNKDSIKKLNKINKETLLLGRASEVKEDLDWEE